MFVCLVCFRGIRGEVRYFTISEWTGAVIVIGIKCVAMAIIIFGLCFICKDSRFKYLEDVLKIAVILATEKKYVNCLDFIYCFFISVFIFIIWFVIVHIKQTLIVC